MHLHTVILLCLTLTPFSVLCQGDITTENVKLETSTDLPTPEKFSSTTIEPRVNTSCSTHDNDCSNCVKNSQCYYCQDNKKCNVYRISKEVIPTTECKLKSINYGTCTINFLVEIILIGVGAGILLVGVIACCCCCCCRKGGRGIKLSKDDLKWARQREERRIRAEEKRKERSERTAEIKKKYGLIRDAPSFFKDDNTYQRFDA